jgi:formate hydrogenlyase subunit 3/multisubunit Na+/H+ antiporter MnhD subunit
LLGYAALSDLGYLLLALGVAGSQGLSLSILHGINRGISIALLAAALAILRHRTGTCEFAKLRGMARHLPIATLGLVVGGLAMAGFPFTATFPTRWAISRAVWTWAQPISTLAPATSVGADAADGRQWVWALVVVALAASSIGVVAGLLRGLGSMLGIVEAEARSRQPIIASLMVSALIALVVLLGLYPQMFLEQVQAAARALF